ncbi:MAG: hypothetical protein V7661_15330, partial [Sulfitobacter sp.]
MSYAPVFGQELGQFGRLCAFLIKVGYILARCPDLPDYFIQQSWDAVHSLRFAQRSAMRTK